MKVVWNHTICENRISGCWYYTMKYLVTRFQLLNTYNQKICYTKENSIGIIDICCQRGLAFSFTTIDKPINTPSKVEIYLIVCRNQVIHSPTTRFLWYAICIASTGCHFRVEIGWYLVSINLHHTLKTFRIHLPSAHQAIEITLFHSYKHF